MKLLFDHNLSHKLCQRLLDLFPDSIQTRMFQNDEREENITKRLT